VRTAKSVAARSLRRPLSAPHQHRVCQRSRPALRSASTWRLKLIIRPPELSHLRGNCLYNTDDDFFMAASPVIFPIVPLWKAGLPVASLLASARLRVLTCRPNPKDTRPLDMAGSEKGHRDRRLDAVIRAVRATRRTPLREALRQAPGFHSLTMTPKCSSSPAAVGSLALDDGQGGIHSLSGEMLAAYLDGTRFACRAVAARRPPTRSKKTLAGIAHNMRRSA